MNKIIFVTTNQAKIKSLEDSFEDFEIEIQGKSIDLDEIRSDSVEQVAAQKVKDAFEIVKAPVVAQDGGFFIQALNGFPGTYVNPAMKTIGVQGILKLLEGKQGEERSAYFIDVAGYMDSSLDQPKLFTSKVEGYITDQVKGDLTEQNWGAPHLIFIPEGSDKTFAEMDEDEMKQWRKKYFGTFCLKEFAKWYQQNLAT